MPAIRWIGTTNRTPGPSGYHPRAVVIHIMEGTLAATDSWFNTAKSSVNPMPVSAHDGVGPLGDVHHDVGEGDTARHAGRVYRPSWPELLVGVNPNLYTVGIEHEGCGDTVWAEPMYQAGAWLVASVANRWGISVDSLHVVGHHEIFAKKTCPGHVVAIDRLVDMALSVILCGELTNEVSATGTVVTLSRLNVRSSPRALAAIEYTAPPGTSLPYMGWTSSDQSVHGNAHWYRDDAGGWFWAGATTGPIPSTDTLPA